METKPKNWVDEMREDWANNPESLEDAKVLRLVINKIENNLKLFSFFLFY